MSGPTPGAPEREAVRSMFDRIAPRYDLLNRVLSAGTDVRWRRACIDFLELSGPSRLLDLCTGTADVLIEFLGRDPRHRGLGVDFAAEMLARARAKLGHFGSRASLARADAVALPVREGAFDAATMAFGIRNVEDPARALIQVNHALRAGGRFVVLEFSTPYGLFGRLYGAYSRYVLPRVGALVSGDRGAYAYLPASIRRFPEPDEFLARLREAGFVRVARRPLTAGIAQLYRGEKV
ncbi:MAG TPA: ubiquinone/menaquinone biosynthesis methyltransferase [Vicinamibacteria bacterium]|nr:ubiquinone/menaquinone biosynthesis methyltransferase [Vicinamibacteria bacterium]